MADRDEYIYKARLFEQAERYEEMVEYMREVAIKTTTELSIEERNLLSVAYKNKIGAKRAAWRIVSDIENKESSDNTEKLAVIKGYREKIEKELREVCDEVRDLFDEHLLAAANLANINAESTVFFYKMKGDYLRYKAEFVTGEERKKVSEECLTAYKEASNYSKELDPTNSVRLGLALNFSVFYYEILNLPVRACKLARAAFDDAIAELDKLPEESFKDTTLIMQLLRDNLTLWTSDLTQEQKEKEGGIEDLEDKSDDDDEDDDK